MSVPESIKSCRCSCIGLALHPLVVRWSSWAGWASHFPDRVASMSSPLLPPLPSPLQLVGAAWRAVLRAKGGNTGDLQPEFSEMCPSNPVPKPRALQPDGEWCWASLGERCWAPGMLQCLHSGVSSWLPSAALCSPSAPESKYSSGCA